SLIQALPSHPTSTLFPYTTLFRSPRGRDVEGDNGLVAGHEFRPARARSTTCWATTTSFSLRRCDARRNMSKASSAVTPDWAMRIDRKSTRLNSSHDQISYAVFCLK